MKMNFGLGTAILSLMLLTAGTSYAATLDLLGDAKINGNGAFYNDATVRATLTCSTGCEGSNSSAVSNTNNPLSLPTQSTWTAFVSGYSDLFVTANSGDAGELAFVNAVTGGGFVSGTKSASNPLTPFVSNALYILFKIGSEPNVTIVKNTGGLGNTFTFAQVGQGAGLSHYTEFGRAGGGGGGGGPDPIPLPAGFALLLTGLGAVGLLGRRKAKKA